MPHYVYSDIYHHCTVIHWACKECLVRAMCNERCGRTYLQHYLCEHCEGCLTFPCKKVKTSQMYETISRTYGDQMLKAYDKYLEETSIFRLLKRPL